jgi:phosphatidylserine/phosphatidylglycerophosphate/cardiolipin synthase-like enzyme
VKNGLFAALFAVSELVAATGPKLTPMTPAPLPPGVELQFTTDGADIGLRVAELIGLARREVLVSQYALTDIRVLRALSSAVQPPQSIVVAVLIDRNPAVKNYDTPRFLRAQGVPVIAALRGLNGQGWHNQRYLVIDREVVVVTSCDLTGAARNNSENIMVLAQPSLAARFYNNWLEEAAKGTPLP